jgi:hypothetical protein
MGSLLREARLDLVPSLRAGNTAPGGDVSCRSMGPETDHDPSSFRGFPLRGRAFVAGARSLEGDVGAPAITVAWSARSSGTSTGPVVIFGESMAWIAAPLAPSIRDQLGALVLRGDEAAVTRFLSSGGAGFVEWTPLPWLAIERESSGCYRVRRAGLEDSLELSATDARALERALRARGRTIVPASR